MMGGGWRVKSDNPLIGGSVRPSSVSVSYADKDALTHCYRLFCFEYRDTDLY